MKLGFFPYRALHYKAAQAYLDKKAEQGLALQKVYLGCIAFFRKADRPKHFVDLSLNARGNYDYTDPDYLALCGDASWELVQELRKMLLFRAAPTWEAASGLDFDESYISHDGAYLLLRQDKVVALVGCTGVDLTVPENLAVIRERLGLPTL